MLTQFGDSIYLDERVEYVFIRDFGIAYGSIYESFSRYIKNDLKQYMNFFDRERPTFISTAISTVKQFPLPVEFLLSKAKPSISFQYAIDYANRFAPTDIHPADNFEAAMYLRSTDFTEFILGFETTATDNDLGDIRRRDLAISTAYRNIHLTCGVSVNLDSEYDRDNLSQYWQIKRRDGSKYQVQMLVDYEIPYILVMHIADRYGFLDENSNVKRHEFLNFLNKNSVHTVYYTTNGATNKDAYVISKIQEAFVEVGPIGNESFEVDDAVSYTVVNRTFELDVRIPMFFAVTRYGERFLFNEGNTLSEMGVDDLANHSAEVNRGFLLREFQRVFEEKHAIKEQILQYQEEDILDNAVRYHLV